MSYKSNKEVVASMPVLFSGRKGWVAGLRWQEEVKVSFNFKRDKGADTHKVYTGRKPNRMIGFARPATKRRVANYYSLAAAFLLSEGGDSYGIYAINEQNDSWLFLATVRGRISVMGDVVGTRLEVEAARDRFIEFNDPLDARTGWNCSATPEEALTWNTLIQKLTVAQHRTVRMHQLPSIQQWLILATAGVGVISALFYWRDDAALQAQQAAALAELHARQAFTNQKPVVSLIAEHPWATLLPSSAFLSQCWFTREPLPVTLAGWPLIAGECTKEGLRLRYIQKPGGTASDFALRAKQLLGQNAQFDLTEGGQNGDVYIPFSSNSTIGRNESVPSVDEQLMRFISHLQRRNIRVQFTEVKPPEVIPGSTPQRPPQDWREFTFSVNSKLAPEWLLAGCDDTGLRLFSIAFTLSPQGQFDYTIKGSLYAKS